MPLTDRHFIRGCSMVQRPSVTSSTSCSTDRASAMAQARMAGPAILADSVSPVMTTMRRRELNISSMPNASTKAS